MEFSETLAAIEGFRALHPDVSGIFIEHAANGAAAIATLAAEDSWHQCGGCNEVEV
jgi:hypothetical protein